MTESAATIVGPVLEVSFLLQGKSIPVDHAFALYSAISRVWPAVHGNPGVSILPLQGLASGNRTLSLKPRARLRLRLPADQLPSALALAGKTLTVAGESLLLGVPTVTLLQPAASLHSRLVTIKGFTDPAAFERAATRSLLALGVTGTLTLERVKSVGALEGRTARTPGEPIRRTIQIHGKQIVGFAVRVDGLSDADSIALQSSGLGGRRRFGCGIFMPVPSLRSAV